MAVSRTLSPCGIEEESEDGDTGRLLDGFLLLAAGGASVPEEVISANLTSHRLVDVVDEDLRYFQHLDRLDISDNKLSSEHLLGQLGQLPRLGTLSLACNTLKSFIIPKGTLPSLQLLDLSYNGLQGDVLTPLSRLRGLLTLNLSSNCISCLPPEDEIMGFQSLAELILDSNDLVQFVQWRGLDALPQLKKLSLKSNRIKKIKDDMPDTAGEEASYFEVLEVLDLTSNEVARYDHLPALQCFRSLRTVILTNNPVMRDPALEGQGIPGMTVEGARELPQPKSTHSSPLLGGAGRSRGRLKSGEPKVKLNRKKMHRVQSTPQIRSRGQPNHSQLCVYGEEAGELLASLRPGEHHEAAERGLQLASLGQQSAVASTAATSSAFITDDLLSEEELDEILRARRVNIDQQFNAPIHEEPTRFMKEPPFPMWRSCGRSAGPVGGDSRPGSPSKLFSLTSLPEDPWSRSRDRLDDTPVSRSLDGNGTMRLRRTSTTPSTFKGTGTLEGGATGQLTLPAIPLGPRTISAGGDSSASVGSGAAQPPKLVADGAVRDALRVLRAAVMSEYAVIA